MESVFDYHSARAMLEWQIDLGVTETISDAPINRFEAVQEPVKPKATAPVENGKPTKPAPPVKPVAVDAVAEAQKLADQATTLEELAKIQSEFELCDLKKGARKFVFADGNPKSRLLILGEAPGRDEDQQGRPFAGEAGQLLDKMLAAIDMDRTGENSAYVTNVMPWRPPQNRDPSVEEIAMMMPFVSKHIELVSPDVVILMGNVACLAALSKKGITRLRGNWATAFERPVMPIFHPAYLLRTPVAKRDAWADLLAVQAKLKKGA
ncbi:MAG: uracil-DNA glycosylase [Paracoccaceae bacterium]|nr:uracil-DNA glycosylase [Paracoccaceae bacterium]